MTKLVIQILLDVLILWYLSTEYTFVFSSIGNFVVFKMTNLRAK